jgi:hypothetical protein
MGYPEGDIDGGTPYWLGQIDAITPAEFEATLITPIWLSYRMLLGSALANIGAFASASTVHKDA